MILDITIIGPGRKQGNYLVGYFVPGTRNFMPLADCNTESQAKIEKDRLSKEARARETVARNYLSALGQYPTIRGFYSDNE